MQIYGIIGYPLGHSRSPRYFNERFREEGIEAEYLSFEMEDVGELQEILQRYPELKGFNVTIPHKQDIIPLLDELSDEAREIGAVNCVKVTERDGKRLLTGYNTDMSGFRKALSGFIPEDIKKALILGNGGAAKAVRYALRTLGIKSLTVSRTPRGEEEIGYAELEKYIGEFRLVVNTTPLGTWPKVEGHPDVPYDKLTRGHYLFDLVYNPEITEFMKLGRAVGAQACNGYEMWKGQAEEAERIWEG